MVDKQPAKDFQKWLALLSIVFGIWAFLILIIGYTVPIYDFKVAGFITITSISASIIALVLGTVALIFRDKKGLIGILFGIIGLIPFIYAWTHPLYYELIWLLS